MEDGRRRDPASILLGACLVAVGAGLAFLVVGQVLFDSFPSRDSDHILLVPPFVLFLELCVLLWLRAWGILAGQICCTLLSPFLAAGACSGSTALAIGVNAYIGVGLSTLFTPTGLLLRALIRRASRSGAPHAQQQDRHLDRAEAHGRGEQPVD